MGYHTYEPVYMNPVCSQDIPAQPVLELNMSAEVATFNT